MKNILRITFVTGWLLVLQSCAEDFLGTSPKDALPETVAFDNNVIKIYTWQFYSFFPAYDRQVLDIDFDSDLFARANKNGESRWAFQKVNVPASDPAYTSAFANIRAVNLLLDKLDKAAIGETDRKHWRSVCYFFKAYVYADLVNRYGDITWLETTVSENSNELTAPRTPRTEVAQKILEMLTYAEANIKPQGDGENTINTHVVRALISRFGLMEGTWRKYHNLPGTNTYLNACVKASEKLITAFPNLHPNYGQLFTNNSLAGVAGIILYKNHAQSQVTHNLRTLMRSSGGNWDLTRKAMDMYLMTDGQTRWTSSLFKGDKSPYTEFRNRDRRLYFTTPPPYKVNQAGSDVRNWVHTNNTADREYIDFMKTISDDPTQELPHRNWGGIVLKIVPHFGDNANGQPFNNTYTGYQFHKMGSRLNEGISGSDLNDAPIFRIEETMLNYAEALFELGNLTQTLVDKTINKLRNRAGVAPLVITAVPNDPKRDTDIDPVLWEIRRERAVELMGEGFRFNDLRRWKKMSYVTEQKLGMWIVKSEQNNKIPTLNNEAANYVAYEGEPPSSFPEHYYLYPVPTNEILLTNGNIQQNPGWTP